MPGLLGDTPPFLRDFEGNTPGQYCGWTKSCTTSKPWETTVCWYLQGNHHAMVSQVMQDFLHPQ